MSPKKIFSPSGANKSRNISSFEEVKSAIKDLKKKNISYLKGTVQRIRHNRFLPKGFNKTVQGKFDKNPFSARKIKSPMVRHNALSPIADYTNSSMKKPSQNLQKE